MYEILNDILVVGHQNPDTDASAAAVSYAEFLNRVGRYPQTAVGVVPGHLTPQTQYVFQRSGVPVPSLIKSVVPRVGHFVNRQPITLQGRQRISDAVNALVRSDRSMLPILTEDRRLSGVFSHRSDAARFLFGFNATNLWGTFLQADDLLELPGISVAGEWCEPKADSGSLIVAMEGAGDWVNVATAEDLLVCGNPRVIEQIPAARRPRTVVVINESFVDNVCIEQLNRQQITVMTYEGTVAQFFHSLALQIRLECLELPTGPCVGEFDPIGDVRDLLQSNHHALPVLNESGEFVGVVSRTDLRSDRRCKVVLVDHFEKHQSVEGIETAEVLEILDHHRVGDIETNGPIRVTCHPVGSASTIIASNYLETKTELDRGIALLLLGGVMADTLGLQGPTTTHVDHQIAQALGEIAAVVPHRFAMDVLREGDDLMTSDPAKIWRRDQKQFTIQNQNFAVAQLETVSLEQLPDDRLNEFARLIDEDQLHQGRLLSMLVLTDVLKGDSWIYASESASARGMVAGSFSSVSPKPGWIAAPGVVSRKKQIVPRLMSTLAESQLPAVAAVT